MINFTLILVVITFNGLSGAKAVTTVITPGFASLEACQVVLHAAVEMHKPVWSEVKARCVDGSTRPN